MKGRKKGELLRMKMKTVHSFHFAFIVLIVYFVDLVVILFRFFFLVLR